MFRQGCNSMTQEEANRREAEHVMNIIKKRVCAPRFLRFFNDSNLGVIYKAVEANDKVENFERLHDDAIRPLRHTAVPDLRFAAGDLREGAAKVHGRGPPACVGRPGHRAVERPVELEDAGTVDVTLQPLPVAVGQRRAADLRERRGARVEEHDARRREIGEAADVDAGLDARLVIQRSRKIRSALG